MTKNGIRPLSYRRKLKINSHTIERNSLDNFSTADHHTVLGLLNALDMAHWEFDQMKKKDLQTFFSRHVQPYCYYIPFHELVVTMLKAKLIIRTNDLSIIKFDNERVMVKLGEIQSGILNLMSLCIKFLFNLYCRRGADVESVR